MLELNDGTIPCWTREEIKVLKLGEDKLQLKLTKSFPLITDQLTLPIQLHNTNIIYACGYG
jgi:hypothetical protein